jgi:iron(II)-dependent oxidoreductase
MRSSNSPSAGNVLSKLPEWFGGIIGGSGGESRTSKKAAASEPEPQAVKPDAAPVEELLAEEPVSAAGLQSVVDEMLAQNRYALLLRPQLVKNLSRDQLSRTRAALSDRMCLVPEGQVVLRRDASVEWDKENNHGPVLHLEAYYLDRYPVTNAQYQHFVSAGGYEQMAIWDSEIWPALLDFVDLTGHPGPRFWRAGHFPRGEDNLPVVGVSWYEAVAYARWVGKRLPSDAEWVKAGSWPVSIQGHPLLLRRYPWGEAMDRSRANLWGSGPGKAVSVHEFPGGVSVGGVHQLIGNVWEWTADAYAADADDSSPTGQPKLKSIRGGAFDTYLDCQATCHFQSADAALARKHNIGLRCAINLSDLERAGDDESSDEEQVATSIAEDRT